MKIKIHVPVFCKMRRKPSELHASSSLIPKYVALSIFETYHIVPITAPSNDVNIWRAKTKNIYRLVVLVTWEVL